MYLSAPLYHAVITGLAPNTRYYYVVGTPSALSMEFSFITPPAPNTAATFPFTLGVIADIGQTMNTSMGSASRCARARLCDLRPCSS